MLLLPRRSTRTQIQLSEIWWILFTLFDFHSIVQHEHTVIGMSEVRVERILRHKTRRTVRQLWRWSSELWSMNRFWKTSINRVHSMHVVSSRVERTTHDRSMGSDVRTWFLYEQVIILSNRRNMAQSKWTILLENHHMWGLANRVVCVQTKICC